MPEPDRAGEPRTAQRRFRFWLPAAFAVIVLSAIGVTTWAVVDSGHNATRAEQATRQAAQVRADSDTAAAARVAAEKAAAEQAEMVALRKATETAEAKKAAAEKALADEKKSRADAERREPVRTVIIDGGSDYSGGPYGTFGLTAMARPGPIHVYESPTDTSRKLYPVDADEYVTVYCSVRGQSINGHNYWDWNGRGWIWDKMVDIDGHSPPPCGD